MDVRPCDTPELCEGLHKNCPAADLQETPLGAARSCPPLHIPICQTLSNQNLYCKILHNHEQAAAFLHHFLTAKEITKLYFASIRWFYLPFNFFCPFFFNSTMFLHILEKYFIMCCRQRFTLPFASTLLECRNISVHQLLKCIILSVGSAKSRICQWVNISIELHLYFWNVGSAEFQLCH